MKNYFLPTLLLFPLLAGVAHFETEMSPPAISQVTYSTDYTTPVAFNSAVFEQSVANKMKNTSKGYAFAIGDKDGIKGKSAGGWAQDPEDGNLRMTTKIPSCIGSVTKMISSTALLNLLEGMPGVKLDDVIFSKLPKKWQQKYKGTRVECITYRQLLQHKTGFSKGDDVANLDDASKNAKACPYTASRSYNNSNISLLRYLITALAYPQEVPGIEEKLKDLSFDEYSIQANVDFSFPYERYVKKFILEKGLVPIEASCRPEPELMPKVAKGYSDRVDKSGGLTTTEANHKAKGNHCAPQGSWYFSAEMLVHFGRTMLYSNNYLTATTRNMMFDANDPGERLGWANFDTNDDFGKEFGQSKWPWHDGAQNGYFAVMIQLPGGYVGAVLVNSSINLDTEPNPVSTVPFLINTITDAFYEATRGIPSAEIAKHGVAEANYQEEFNLVGNSGYYPVWVDGYDVSGKTFFNVVFRHKPQNYEVRVRHDMTKEVYQQEYDEWVKQKGYRLENLDNYNDAGRLKLAAVFIKKPGGGFAQPAYHAVSQQVHQDNFEKYSNDGFVPVNVSVVSIDGKLYYSAFYEKRNVGGHVLKSTLSQKEYQDMYEDMKAKKWEQVYINAYHHENQTRFSVIWYERSGFQSVAATRKSTGESYQQLWSTNTGNGLLTRCVTGYDEGGKHWFAAAWAK